MESLLERINRLRKSKHFLYGAPFVLSVVGGSFALQFYSQVRYDIHKERHIMTKTKELQAILKPPKTLEEEYEEYKKNVNIDDWKNIRGPRPWESENTDFKDLIEKRAKDAKSQWIFKS